MATVVSPGTPLAEALSSVMQPKLVEMGWSSDSGEDSALIEYVILMLANGKTQEQIAGELSNDLLGLGEEGDTQALEFSKWLFEQVEILNTQINGGGAASAPEQAIPSFGAQDAAVAQPQGLDPTAQEFEMSDAAGDADSIPTGPKAMRNGRQQGRGRMLNQINRAMDRQPDSPLHRIRGQQGTGRINSHGRDHMKGGRGFQNGGRMLNGRNMGGMGNQANPMMQMNPQDQMHLMALFEEQARMMAQFMPGMVPPAINPAFQQGGPQQGRSLFDRVERGPRQQGHFNKRGPHHGFSNRAPQHDAQAADVDMDTNPDRATTADEHEEGNTNSVCRWNLRCTRKDCPYAHQSPAAPDGVAVDVNDVCSFGAACKNKKCTGRHPSPAVKTAHQAEELCRFFPHCANPHCTFKHPDMPLCRNGADCTAEDCKFTHIQTPCRFNPCMNRTCPYKHSDGQRGAYTDRVWTADGTERRPHVSERKFVVDENAPEELIKPDAEGSQNTEIVT
ncbi:hypothetical protein ASPZODRAFT_585806 [Penicilliopsis zonata CBS 506.65]|uniref:Nab2-like CCCH zinc finger domain-containing protein n=1 Tax=Penicilliopsis zonata CBS 506.65 TaxID=1073090 RepID=A0A1L9SDY7_9EURO|nr:hypothetical protein ASPZODRAFT_585806 [Penicilliopsis zonata CBS 506.65]OJJ45391.1 hypothetical protein ASPZODRAFT_585806 [Penicilliopsis zonata CBS 506.65]